ncbi:hypothetical protein T08_10182 [Trichinella sp. T8]|nr:hypothetical protein T08_10182 [Trichinella sp. T8]
MDLDDFGSCSELSNNWFYDFLLTMDLRRAETDHCIYVSAPGAEFRIILGLCVDDDLLCCSDLTVDFSTLFLNMPFD